MRRPFYDDGGVTLFNGEAFEVLAELEPASVDAVVTDPPYSSGGQFRGDRTQNTAIKYGMTTRRRAGESGDGDGALWVGKSYALFSGDNRDQRGFAYWSTLWLSAALRVTKPGGVVAMFADWRQLAIATDVLQSGGWVLRGIAVWDKGPGCRPTRGRFAAQSEFVVWGSNGPMPDPDKGGVPKCLPGVFQHHVNPREKFHQTGKPPGLMRDVLQIVPEGGTVLDPFAGSGTTLIAARDMGCPSIGVELVEDYCCTTRDRLAQGALFACGV